jgi:hypothetical protein
MVYSGTSVLTTGKFWAGWLAGSTAFGGPGAYLAGVYYATTGGGIAALGVAAGPGSIYVIGTLSALEGPLGPDGSELMELPATAYSWATNEDILQKTMSFGDPIRDLNGAEDPIQGSMLALERQVLSDAGWILQQAKDGYYYWTKP